MSLSAWPCRGPSQSSLSAPSQAEPSAWSSARGFPIFGAALSNGSGRRDQGHPVLDFTRRFPQVIPGGTICDLFRGPHMVVLSAYSFFFGAVMADPYKKSCTCVARQATSVQINSRAGTMVGWHDGSLAPAAQKS